jgi:hypothetical protein
MPPDQLQSVVEAAREYVEADDPKNVPTFRHIVALSQYSPRDFARAIVQLAGMEAALDGSTETREGE